jgi:hypothetical protein
VNVQTEAHKPSINKDTETKNNNAQQIAKACTDLVGKLQWFFTGSVLDVFGKSDEISLSTVQGKRFSARLLINNKISRAPTQSTLRLTLITEDQNQETVIAWRRYWFSPLPLDDTTLDMTSFLGVDSPYDHSGIGSALLALDPIFHQLIARNYRYFLQPSLKEILLNISDGTDTQNPQWTTRRMASLDGWSRVNATNWQKRVLIEI